MRVEREVVGVELFRSLGVGSVVQQDGAEDGFLGVDVGGQTGVEREVGDGGHFESLGRAVGVQKVDVFGNLENEPEESSWSWTRSFSAGYLTNVKIKLEK